jgi:hypothetical protein
MPDQIIIEELIDSALVRYGDDDGNLMWDVHLLCADGVTREYTFSSEQIAEEFVLTYCDTTDVVSNGLD